MSYLNTASIVGDLQEFEATLLDQYLESGGTCVNGVLDQFFQRIDRGNNDLSSGDFIDYILIEGLHTPVRSVARRVSGKCNSRECDEALESLPDHPPPSASCQQKERDRLPYGQPWPSEVREGSMLLVAVAGQCNTSKARQEGSSTAKHPHPTASVSWLGNQCECTNWQGCRVEGRKGLLPAKMESRLPGPWVPRVWRVFT